MRALLLFSYIVSLIDSASSKNLFYRSNSAGLFSQFIQLKLMYHFAQTFNRALVVEKIKSRHYKNSVLMNDVFNFSGYSITSSTGVQFETCYNTTDELLPLMNSDISDLCYGGPFPVELTGENITRNGILQSLGLDPPLRLKRVNYLSQLMRNLNIDPSLNFTVVHWRRGDQTTRCKSGMDASVNCGTGYDFVAKIKEYTHDNTIYVATNEKRYSKDLVPLRRAQMKTITDGSIPLSDELSVLSLEVELMLRATTFLAWGVSEIDDVVEYERMKAGKSFCVAYEPYIPDRNLTFCYLVKELHRLPKSTMMPYILPATVF